jgi:hypothetical protein
MILRNNLFLYRICEEVQACEPAMKKMVREMTCEDCELNMDDVRVRLTAPARITGNTLSQEE